jgi:hypothetical protein
MHTLAEACAERLPVPVRALWGNYYSERPIVTAVAVNDAASALGL